MNFQKIKGEVAIYFSRTNKHPSSMHFEKFFIVSDKGLKKLKVNFENRSGDRNLFVAFTVLKGFCKFNLTFKFSKSPSS